jgi:hypothetical protein
MPKVIELLVLSGSSVVDCSDVDLLRTAFHHLRFKVLLVGKTQVPDKKDALFNSICEDVVGYYLIFYLPNFKYCYESNIS